jgi:RHS repeat-associated protein
MRLRQRTEYAWSGTKWNTNSTVRYAYDGNVVVQEQDQNNTADVSYTRGRDLSGTMQGAGLPRQSEATAGLPSQSGATAGGIGSLLARSANTTGAHAYYFADGNGNITCMTDTNQAVVASYLYDPYGRILSQSGWLAAANLYRFSSKEFHVNSGLIYYLYRFYDPSLQRWLTRDPLDEVGGLNLYGFLANNPTGKFDPDGRNAIAIGAGVGSCFCPGVGTTVGAIVGVIVTAIGIAVICTSDTPPKGMCEFYSAWCNWGNKRPPNDPGKGWKRNAPCSECYQSCKQSGSWDFSKCPMGGPNGPRWPQGGKWPGGGSPVWPTPGQY